MLPDVNAYAQQTIGTIGDPAAQEVSVSGAAGYDNNNLLVQNGSSVTANSRTVKVRLQRGGEMQVCATTSVHLNQTGHTQQALMYSLDRGAMEVRYKMGTGSDVLLTPDLRILISGPGEADLRVRVNPQGDTCVENRGANAPYLTVTEQIGEGLYRVQPNQRALFEHGSIHEVVDHELDPCGCPAEPPLNVGAEAGPGALPRQGDPFPLAQSQGLAPARPASTAPVAPPGQAHAEVSADLGFNGSGAPVTDADSATKAVTNASGTPSPSQPSAPARLTAAPTGLSTGPPPAPPPPSPPPASQQKSPPPQDLVHAIGRFFSRLFGRK